MDQYLVALAAVVALALFGLGYYVGVSERDSRRRYEPTEDGRWPL